MVYQKECQISNICNSGMKTDMMMYDLGSHSGGYEEFYLLGYTTVYSIESQPALRIADLAICFHTGFLLGIF
jgi:hypothetical protein